ncbi:unnamed protein product, partial [Mesorhabditis spiculigera]
MLSILHLIAIYAPSFFWKLELRAALLSMSIPTALAIASVAVYFIVCPCTMYAIPGYYLTYDPAKSDITRVVSILLMVLKGGMFLLILATDAVIVCKLYPMKVFGRKTLRTENGSRTTTVDPTNPRIIVTNQTSRLRVGLDKRLVVAFLFVAFAYMVYAIYFTFLSMVPTAWVPYLNLTIYGLDACKCTVYVLIVTLK